MLLSLFCLVFAGPAVCGEDPPHPPRRIYLALDDHTDYMWTADEETFRKVFVRTLDYYLDQIERTAGDPPEFQSRFNCDGSLWLWAYENERSPEQVARLIERVRSGHINVPLNTLVSCYGGMPTEAVLRSMYYAGSLERRFELRLPMALALENQTRPYGLCSLWAGSGARYTWTGICNCVTRVPDTRDRPHPLYWWVGPDGQRILTKWYPLIGNNQSIGGYAEARRPEEAIRQLESHPYFRVLHPCPVFGIFGKGWDDLETLTDEFPKIARRMTTPQRQVIVSNEIDFFQDVERSFGDRLPEMRGSLGNEWELFEASLAEPSSSMRRAIERLRSAEATAAMIVRDRPEFWTSRQKQRTQTMVRWGMYYEHCFGAGGPLSLELRERWHRRIADETAEYVDRLHADALDELGRMIRGEEGKRRFFVFNPLGWSRTDAVDLPVAPTGPVHVVQVPGGQQVPHQSGRDSAGRPVLRILARDVPPIGYVVYELREGAGRQFPDAARIDEGVLENEFYTITLAPSGAITRLFDRHRRRELAATIDGRTINDIGGNPGTIERVESGPVCVRLRAFSDQPLPHSTEITLVHQSPRIAIRNEILQNFADVRTWDFSFAIDKPTIRHEELGAVLSARLVPDGGHYAAQNARYDWLTLNHFADLTGDDFGVTLSNWDCSFMRVGRSTLQQLDTTTPRVSVLAGGRVDGPGFANQGGDKHFLHRFAISTHDAFDPYEAMRFALEHQNPLVAGAVTGEGTLPAGSDSLLPPLPGPLVLWACKPAEEGFEQRGLILRIWNVSDQPVDHDLRLTPPIQAAIETTHLETDLSPIPLRDATVPIRFGPRRMKTWRLTIQEGS